MISVKFNDTDFFKDIMNVAKYSEGFIDGAQLAKPKLLNELAIVTIEAAKEFIDTNARIDPQRLHHVYEWYMTGSPESRLYDINYTLSNNGAIFTYEFRQSQSLSKGSNTPFYNKAEIMELGIPVTIRPKNSSVLVFTQGDETIFRPGPIVVDKPGGDVQGEFEKILDIFFNKYFTQSFLEISGIAYNLEHPKEFKKYLKKRSSRSEGTSAGYEWIAGAIK